ncbi:MAG: ABC transporter ATP-binding protein [Thermoplasmata archaeon]
MKRPFYVLAFPQPVRIGMATPEVELEGINKSFGEVVAVSDVDLTVDKNEFFSLLGPSGCGKTTTLRIIAGLEEPDEGIVRIRGRVVNEVPTHKRKIGMVFQNLALFPHMSVSDNIAFGLKMKKLPKGRIRARIETALEFVDMTGLGNRRIGQLSGGQQQRVAIARALVTEPTVLLLDEPLGALDLKIRQMMQLELKNIQEKVGTTFIYVTHDQEEAFTMSDRIAVMSVGEIEQIGSPREIYNSPRTRLVADFIGETNFVDGKRVDRALFESEIGSLSIQVLEGEGYVDRQCTLFIRPEKIRVGKRLEGLANVYDGIIEEYIFQGPSIIMRIRAQGDLSFRAIVPTVDVVGLKGVGDKTKFG